MKKPIVVAALSGGVDSSVSAFLLKESGYEVIGMFMRNWVEEDDSGACTQQKDYEDVVKVSEKLGIPFYTVDLSKEYWDSVFTSFLGDLKQGLTPNPDILCNREIKFNVFLQKALSFGADFLATGHYVKVDRNKQLLFKANDLSKDQSYFLHAINRNSLNKVLFPIGHLTKKEVREIAKRQQLPTHNKKDSTGICFIGKRPFAPFLKNYLKVGNGPIVNLEGKVVGEHVGAIYYTIGQRKGLRIGGPGDAWFVVSKNIHTNTLLVAQGENHPSLFSKTLTATHMNWLIEPPTLPFSCKAKIRYRQADESCCLEKNDEGSITVTFEKPQRAVTPGQSVVFYHEDICLGGGIIKVLSPISEILQLTTRKIEEMGK